MAQYLHAMHDAGGEHLFGDKPGWIVHTIALRQERQGDFTHWQNQGISSIVRLNYDHDGRHGTIPPQGDYALFAKMCADYVSSSPGCNIVIIGNEPNHKQEWPNGEVITPEQYAACFNMCYQQIKERRPDVLVLVAGMACWNDQAGIGWLEYFKRMCAAIVACDGFAIHGYTHGSDPNLIWSMETVNGWRWHFPVIYQTMQTIPERFAMLDCYVTETNQGDEAWVDNNNGWVKNAFASVDGYNGTATTQKIRCLALYRWKTDDKYSIVDKPGVQADFRDAVARGYQSPTGTVPNPGPTPPDPNPGPTPPPSDGDYLEEWDTRLDQRGTVLEVIEGSASDRHEYHVTKGKWYDKDQAQGRVNVFLTLLDEQGNLLNGVPVKWSWDDGSETKNTEKKSDPWLGGQYSLDFAMYKVAPSYTLQIADGQPSDVLMGMGLGDLQNPHHTIHTCYAFTVQRMAVGSAPNPPDPNELSALFVTAPAGANMRQSADTASPIVVAIPYGEKVLSDGATVAPDGYTWRHAYYEQYNGWIRGDLLGLYPPVPIPPPDPTPDPDPTPMGKLIWPVKGRVTNRFGEGEAVFKQDGHAGIDIAVVVGTPVLSIEEGTVIETGKELNYGNYVRVLHPKLNSFSFFAHLSEIKVQKGDVVKQGQPLALSGNTGNSSGPHLHFELRAHDGRGGYADVTFGYLQGRYNPQDAYLLTGSPLTPG